MKLCAKLNFIQPLSQFLQFKIRLINYKKLVNNVFNKLKNNHSRIILTNFASLFRNNVKTQIYYICDFKYIHKLSNIIHLEIDFKKPRI